MAFSDLFKRRYTHKSRTDLRWDAIYHRGVVDEGLAHETLRRLEVVCSNLTGDDNWSVALYLLFAPDDRSSFNSWKTRLELKRLMASVFWKEASALGFESNPEEMMLQNWGLTLALNADHEPFHCKLQRYSPEPDSKNWSSLDAEILVCEDVFDFSSKGRFATLGRALPVIGDDEEVFGELVCEGNISIAPHLDASQRGARGRKNHVYVTERNLDFLVGPHPGCDLLTSRTTSSTWIRVEPQTASISGSFGIQRNGNCLEGPDFCLRYEGITSSDQKDPRYFGEILRQRLTQTNFSLGTTARTLPRSTGDGPTGYGADWCHLGSNASPILVSLRLSENIVVAVDDKGSIFLQDQVSSERRELRDAEGIEVGGVRYVWQNDRTGVFYGFLFPADVGPAMSRRDFDLIPADETLDAVIARSGTGLAGRTILLPEYVDDELISRRGGVILKFDGNGLFALGIAASSSLRNLFIFSGFQWRCFSSNDEQLWRVELPCEFVFGSTRFSLRKAGNAYSLETHWSHLFQSISQNG